MPVTQKIETAHFPNIQGSPHELFLSYMVFSCVKA